MLEYMTVQMDKKTYIQDIIRKVILIVFYFLMMDVFSTYLAKLLLLMFPSIDKLLATAIMQYVIYVPVLVACILLLKNEIKESIGIAKKSEYKKFLSIIGIGLISAYGLNILGSILSNALSTADNSANEAAIEEMFKSSYGMLIVLLVCIIAPVVEEIVYRGAILRGLEKLKISPAVALIISSLIFGFIHVLTAGDYAQVFPYIFMGLALGFVYQKTKSLVASITIHMLINTISTSLQFFLLMMEALKLIPEGTI